MITFRDNFFFIKFSMLFFILTIFGYWGVDLNSEELYIAFSFFLLIIVSVVLFRGAVSSVFFHMVNSKYFRLLSDLLVAVSALSLNVHFLRKSQSELCVFSNLTKTYFQFFRIFLLRGFSVICDSASVNVALFQGILFLSCKIFF